MGLQELEYQYLATQNGVYTGSINEQRLRYYNSQSSSNYGNVNEAEVAFLRFKTSNSTGSVNDMWMQYLTGLGIIGVSVNEMKAVLYSGGGAAPPSFSPSDISGLLIWLKADSLSLGNDDPVTSWTDSSGNGNDATSVATKYPLFKTNQVNGLPAVKGDGSNDYLVTPSITGGTNRTYFFVAKPGAGTNKYIWSFAGGSSNAFIYAYEADMFEALLTSRVNVGTGNAGFNYFSFVSTTSPGNAATGYKNGTQTETVAATAPSPTGVQTFFSTGDFFAAAHFDGYIAEIIEYDTALSTEDRQTVEGYLATKYGL